VLDDLSGESERLIRLVGDLLTLARERVEVDALVEDACRQAQVLDPRREIVCDAPTAAAAADHDALKRVLLILLDNAIRHAEGPIRVAIEQRDTRVAIRVQDSGPGMRPELCERIFDRFYRGDVSRSSPGFGLGLSIALALVEAQGGTIAVDSRLGEGTTFTVSLPRWDSSSAG